MVSASKATLVVVAASMMLATLNGVDGSNVTQAQLEDVAYPFTECRFTACQTLQGLASQVR